MDNKLFKASLIIRGEAGKDCIREFAMDYLVDALSKDQKIVLEGMRLASPCRQPKGTDGFTMLDLLVLGLVHETTYQGEDDYFSVTPLGLELAGELDCFKG